jgi:hypothetical protein
VAKQAIVTLVDDLDGGSAAETVRFGIDGQDFEIDLSPKNAARLRKQFAPFIERGRPAGPGARRPRRTAASRRRSRDIRAWAVEHGIELSERGRIPASVVDRYQAAARRAARGLAVAFRSPGLVRAYGHQRPPRQRGAARPACAGPG